MNLSDLKSVNKAAEALGKIRSARKSVSEFIQYQTERGITEVPGILDNGYQCFLMSFNDGSGPRVDMAGCYVGIEAVVAVDAALAEKEKTIVEWLANMGVTP